MGTLIVFALSNAATMLFTAWILHRHKSGQSPIPSLGGGVNVSEDEQEPIHKKGRPTV